jgi:cyclic pyranopterin phosphate synthase
MPECGIYKKSHEEMLTEEEMIRAVEAAASLGIKKVRITGGEPLIKKNVLSICQKVAEIGGIEEVCLTTNGVLLSQLAKPLKEAGVKSVNISLDTLNREKFQYLTRVGSFEEVWSGFLKALEVGFEKVKINTVLIGGFNDDEISELANLTREYPVDVRFIELMPMYDGGDFGPEALIPYSVMLEKLPELLPVKKEEGVAKLYRFVDGKGNVGLISPVNSDFCGSCNRLRLTADGNLKPCLHAKEEFPIKGMDFAGMAEQMKRAIGAKPACHGELSYENRSRAGRLMNEIGG